jgi:large subunit ribosomal protein L14
MIQRQSYANVADNSGAKKVQIIGIPYAPRKYATLGDVVTVTVKVAAPNSPAKKGKDIQGCGGKNQEGSAQGGWKLHKV